MWLVQIAKMWHVIWNEGVYKKKLSVISHLPSTLIYQPSVITINYQSSFVPFYCRESNCSSLNEREKIIKLALHIHNIRHCVSQKKKHAILKSFCIFVV